MTEQTDEMFFPEADSAEEAPAEGAPAGEAPAREAPAGEAPAREAPAGEAPAGEAPAGEAPAGEAAAVDTRPGELTETQLEALLFVAERPLRRSEIAQLAGVDLGTVDACIGDLHVTLSERGIRLVESGEHVELATAPDAGRLIARYVGADAPRLSSASLETLAIVAYRQPCTRATIERIRGVDSDYTLRTLMHRRLIAELGRSDAPGRPILFGTGFDFLERFGLTSVDELPPLEPEIAERLFSAAEDVGRPGPDGLGLGYASEDK